MITTTKEVVSSVEASSITASNVLPSNFDLKTESKHLDNMKSDFGLL